jgi:hypothetical protein
MCKELKLYLLSILDRSEQCLSNVQDLHMVDDEKVLHLLKDLHNASEFLSVGIPD